jgi:hypothetical protein
MNPRQTEEPSRAAMIAAAGTRLGAVLSGQRLCNGLGYLALAGWLAFWLSSYSNFRLQLGGLIWLPPLQYLGFDFEHNYLAARAWVAGLNPYVWNFGDARGLYVYPPQVLPLFAWTALVADFRLAAAIWAFVVAVCCAWGVVQIQLLRRAEGLTEVPLAMMLAVVLWSAPVVFAMERGNFDALVLACLLAALLGMGRFSRATGTSIAAACLALAAVIKIYPLTIIAALLAMRRYLLTVLTAACIVILWALFADDLPRWLGMMNAVGGQRVRPILDIWQWLRGEIETIPPRPANSFYWAPRDLQFLGALHSPGDWWPALWLRLEAGAIARWPALLVNAVTLGPVTVWGLWRIFRARDVARISLPVLLWVVTVATYWMTLSYDYNLIFLPLLIAALWDRREPALLQALLVVSVLWWLPFGPNDYLSVLARVLAKYLALHAATWLLVRSLTRPRAAA